jgi:cell shape-determining protein MreD
VAFAWLANARGRYAFLVAALVGLASDLSSSAPLGIGMTTFAVMGYAVIFLRQNLHLEGAVARLGIVWLGTTSICLLQGVALRLMGNLALPWATLIERAALVGLYTTGLAIPLLMMLQWFGFKKQSATVIDQPIPAS